MKLIIIMLIVLFGVGCESNVDKAEKYTDIATEYTLKAASTIIKAADSVGHPGFDSVSNLVDRYLDSSNMYLRMSDSMLHR